MATKDLQLSSSILEPITNCNDSRQYTNFNLNKNHNKCSNFTSGHLKSKSNNDTLFHSNFNHDNYQEKSLKLSHNKSSVSSNPFKYEKTEAPNRWKNGCNLNATTTCSTLSLHIEAYEKANEVSNDSESRDMKDKMIAKGGPCKDVKTTTMKLGSRNPFEIPRQASNEPTSPEVMQFKSSQRLLVPNNITTTTKSDDDDNTAPLLGIIFGVFGGIIIIGLCAFGGFFLYRRYRRRRAAAEMEGDQELQFALPPSSTATVTTTSKPVPLDNSDESPPHDPADVEKSLSIPKTTKANKNINVMHIDHTDVMVPAELKKEETRSLLKSMKKTQKIQTVQESEIPTTISKVLTYCTDDDITLGDRSARETVDDLSGSGKPTEFEALLMRLISHGPRQYSFKFDELQKLLEAATKVFADEPSLLECPVPCTVYGDIHGQYSDLHRWFNLNGWPHQTRTVFLGDFVDRGSHGVEVIALLSCLKLVYPDKIFIVRGNHEEESLNRAYSFYEEVICRFSADSTKQGKDGYAMYENFKNLFMQLPLAVLIGGRVLGMHGGLSPKMESLQTIRDIKRPIDDFEVGSLECDLVWSDPDTAADTGFRPNLDREPNNGIGQLFAADTVKETCDRLNIDLILRGHQAPLHGYALFADGRMMTLFSAPGYKGTSSADVNMGACIEFDKNMKITIKQIKVSERFRQNRVNDVEKMKVQRKELRKRIAASKSSEKK